MALQRLSKHCIVLSSMAAGRFEQQVKAHGRGSGINQPIQHGGVNAPRPRPLGELLQQGIATEISIGGLLQAEVINGHDHQALRHRPHATGFLHPTSEAQLQPVQPGAAQSAAHRDRPTEGEDSAMTTDPAQWNVHVHG